MLAPPHFSHLLEHKHVPWLEFLGDNYLHHHSIQRKKLRKNGFSLSPSFSFYRIQSGCPRAMPTGLSRTSSIFGGRVQTSMGIGSSLLLRIRWSLYPRSPAFPPYGECTQTRPEENRNHYQFSQCTFLGRKRLCLYPLSRIHIHRGRVFE